MYLFYIFTLLAAVRAESIDVKFSILPSLSAVLEGISGLSTLLNTAYDVLSILITDNISEIHDNLSIAVPEDAYFNISQICNKYGYPFEEHTVVTDDGYILNIHRIPHGRNGKRNNISVFLMHGILDSSDSWVIQGPDGAMSFVLADEGFDVWMGNTRGGKHCPNHVKYNSSQSEFWKFTWDEIGRYDITKMIDHILNVTGKEHLYYIGNSQGTTTFYVMNSMVPEYNKKVKMMFSLAPIAWMSHVRSPRLKLFSAAHSTLSYYLSDVNTYVPSPQFFNSIAAYACSAIGDRCKKVMEKIVGNEYRSIDDSILPIMLGHMFSGTSVFQIVHYMQLVNSGQFRRYDYGTDANYKMYGAYTPPDYDLSKITVPVALMYSENDWLSDLSDVEMLKKGLPNVFLYENMKGYIHMDYLYANDRHKKIFPKIINNILNSEKGNLSNNII